MRSIGRALASYDGEAPGGGWPLGRGTLGARMTTHGTSHARDAFAERLAARPLLVDGAMGTLLYSRGVPQRASLTELVLDRPELVERDPPRVHRRGRGRHRDRLVRRRPRPSRAARPRASDARGEPTRRAAGARGARGERPRRARRGVRRPGGLAPAWATAPDRRGRRRDERAGRGPARRRHRRRLPRDRRRSRAPPRVGRGRAAALRPPGRRLDDVRRGPRGRGRQHSRGGRGRARRRRCRRARGQLRVWPEHVPRGARSHGRCRRRSTPVDHAQRRAAEPRGGHVRLRGGTGVLRRGGADVPARRRAPDRGLLRDDTRPHRGDAPGARPGGGTRAWDRGRLRRGRCRRPRRDGAGPGRADRPPSPRRPTRRRRAGSRGPWPRAASSSASRSTHRVRCSSSARSRPRA